MLRLISLACLAAGLALQPALAQTPETEAPQDAGAQETAPETGAPAEPPLEEPAAAPSRLPADQLEAFVDGLVRDAMEAEHYAGVHVAVVEGGETRLLKGYGAASLEPYREVDPQRSLFRIGSLSKTFTWIALMQAVEDGLVDLEAPVNDYLSEDLQVPDEGYGPIRVIDLMSHAPGFEDSALGHLFAGREEDIMSPEAYEAAHRPDRVREPGQFSTYSNYGVLLAGRIIAEVYGADFPTVIDERILDPLGLNRTTFREPYAPRDDLPAPMDEDIAGDAATGFEWKGGVFQPRKYEYATQVAAAGSVSASAADMATYMKLLLNDGELDGVRIYSPETAEAFRTPIIDTPDTANGWAHGFIVSTFPGGYEGYGHGGATMWFRTYLVVVPELDLGVYVSVNTNTGRSLGLRLPSLIIERFYLDEDTPAWRPGDEAFLETADLYTGQYTPTRRAYSGLEKFVMLMNGVQTVSASSEGYLVVGSGPGSHAWVPTDQPGRFLSANSAEVLTFETDESGKAVAFIGPLGTLMYQRAPFLLKPWLLTVFFALTMIAAAATLIGALTRLGRPVAPTPCQRWASIASLATAGLWVLSAVMFLLWAQGASDSEGLMYDWPNGPLPLASTLALLASIGAVVMAGLTVCVWSGRSAEGWSLWRKLRYSVTPPVYLIFAIVLIARGGLFPWA